MGHAFMLSPHRPLALEYCIERGPGFLRQMIGLCICRILPSGYIVAKALYCIGDESFRVTIAMHELCRRPESQIKNIVNHQHLAIAVRPGSDADGRRFNFSGNDVRNFTRNAFQTQ